jgi:hypothetical protein
MARDATRRNFQSPNIQDIPSGNNLSEPETSSQAKKNRNKKKRNAKKSKKSKSGDNTTIPASPSATPSPAAGGQQTQANLRSGINFYFC